MAIYKGPWIVSIPPTMHTWGGKNYIESPKTPKNENEKKDNLRAYSLLCYTNRHGCASKPVSVVSYSPQSLKYGLKTPFRTFPAFHPLF